MGKKETHFSLRYQLTIACHIGNASFLKRGNCFFLCVLVIYISCCEAHRSNYRKGTDLKTNHTKSRDSAKGTVNLPGLPYNMPAHSLQRSQYVNGLAELTPEIRRLINVQFWGNTVGSYSREMVMGWWDGIRIID